MKFSSPEHKRLQLFLKTRRVAAILDEAHRSRTRIPEIAKVLFDLAPGFCPTSDYDGTPVAIARTTSGNRSTFWMEELLSPKILTPSEAISILGTI